MNYVGCKDAHANIVLRSLPKFYMNYVGCKEDSESSTHDGMAGFI